MLFVVAIAIAFSFTACGKEVKTAFPQPTEKFFVNDFASIIDQTDANTMCEKGAALQTATTAQVVLVTVESIDDTTIADYALEIGREWGVGDADKNNGVVILLSKNDREIYISIGYGLEGALPDSKTGRIIDTYGMSYFSNDNFSAGLLSVYNAIVNEIYIEYDMQPAENYVPIDQITNNSKDDITAGDVVLSWIALVVIVVLYVAVFGKRGGLFLFGSPRIFGTGGNFHGGSSGGFGGFSGGGGSFGGGGAGRKF